jgi:hypothetical protein
VVNRVVTPVAGYGFAAAVVYPTQNAPSVAVGDFDGNGMADLAVADMKDEVSVLLGNGNGTFQTAVNYPAGKSPESVAVGDFNGDGIADLAVADNSGGVSVLLGNGDGTFQAAVSYPAGAGPTSVAVGDFNGDGKADLAVANNGGGVNVLLGNSPATMTLNAGTTPQTATAGTAFGAALAVTVKDAGSNPLAGVPVTFTAPGSGASGLFSNSTATIVVATNASGIASASITANASAGGPYNVSAAAGGLSVTFALTNSPSSGPAFSLCDVNQDGTTSVLDVQREINEALGVGSAVNALHQSGIVNIVDVQIVIDALLELGCSAN